MRREYIISIPVLAMIVFLLCNSKKHETTIELKKIDPVFFKPFSYSVPNQHYIYLSGEYTSGLIDLTTKTFYNVNGVISTESHLPAGAIIGGAAGPHHMCVFDTSGNVYCRAQGGNNTSGACGTGTTSDVLNFTKITQDSLGNAFNNVVMMNASSSARNWNTWALKGDGTLWAWGALDGGMEGNGTDGNWTATRPVQITFPGGALIQKMQCGFACEALSTTGDVYTWGCNYNFYQPYMMAQCTSTPVTNSPTKITLPAPAVDIANNGQAGFALLNNGKLYGYAFWAGYTGIGGAAVTDPQQPNIATVFGYCAGLLDTANSAQNFPGSGRTIKKIFSGSVNNYAILSDSTLWVQGDDANGGAGMGVMTNWATYSSPWNWTQSYGEMLHRKWQQMAVGKHDWVDVSTGPALVFYAVFEDASGNLYWCGRNKGNVIANGKGGTDSVSGVLASARPNSWNSAYLEKFDPMKTVAHIIRTSCPYCITNTSASECLSENAVTSSGSAPTGTTNYTTVTVPAGQVITLYGTTTVSSPAKDEYQSYWTHDAGGAYFMPIPGGDTVQFWSNIQGTHVLTRHFTDNLFKTGTSSITVIVGCSSCGTKSRGARHLKRNT